VIEKILVSSSPDTNKIQPLIEQALSGRWWRSVTIHHVCWAEDRQYFPAADRRFHHDCTSFFLHEALFLLKHLGPTVCRLMYFVIIHYGLVLNPASHPSTDRSFKRLRLSQSMDRRRNGAHHIFIINFSPCASQTHPLVLSPSPQLHNDSNNNPYQVSNTPCWVGEITSD